MLVTCDHRRSIPKGVVSGYLIADHQDAFGLLDHRQGLKLSTEVLVLADQPVDKLIGSSGWMLWNSDVHSIIAGSPLVPRLCCSVLNADASLMQRVRRTTSAASQGDGTHHPLTRKTWTRRVYTLRVYSNWLYV